MRLSPAWSASERESNMGSYSPWGPAQDRTPIVDGVSWVSTASHGGLMVTRTAARKYLSAKAVEVAYPGQCGNYVCFEEDCSYAVALYERPEWKRILDRASLQEWRDWQSGKNTGSCGDAMRAHAETQIPRLEAEIARTDEQIKEAMAAIVREWNPEYFAEASGKAATLELCA